MTHTHRHRSHPNHQRTLGRWIFLAIALLVGGLVAAASQAQHHRGGHHGKGHGADGSGHGPGAMLFGVDENDDGALSTGEMNSFLSTADANGDGTLTQEELLALHQARAAEAGVELPEPGRRAGRMYEHVLERLDANDDGLLQTSEVVAHFNELDADDDGSLTGDELPSHGRRGARRHHAVIGMALRAADVDDDHNITTSEWTAFLATVDADGDGQVTFEEVRSQADPDFEPPSVSVDQANELFNSLDANGDGTVSEDELPPRRGERGPRGRRGSGGRGI